MIKSRAKAKAIVEMAHQKVSLAHDKTTPLVFDMSDPGTGKTAVRVWAFAARRRKRGGRLLVLAPRTLLRSAWAADFAKFAPDMRVSVAEAGNRGPAFNADADVYVTNHDAVKELLKLPKTYWAKFDDLIVDESDAYKHHTSQRSRAAQKISMYFKRKACLSATPTANGVCDIWHQAYLLDGGKRLGPNFFGFRNSVCVPTRVGRSEHAIRWIDRDGAEEAVFNQLSDIVIRHKFDECVDIPKTHQYVVDYELTDKQRKSYEEMFTHSLMPLLQLEPDEIADKVARKMGAGGVPVKKPTIQLTAVNAAAVTTKLLQICSGAVYDQAGKYHVLDKSRYEAVMEMAAVRKHPLIPFFWQHQRDLLVAEAEKRDMTYCVMDGNSTDRERTEMVMAYQAGLYDVFFGHPKTVAHGLTLTRGTSIIWPGPTYDLTWFKQLNGRQARIGQKEKTEIIVMLAKDTLEEDIYNNILMAKAGRMTNLLDLFGSMTTQDLAVV